MKQYILLILNTISLAGVLVVNYLSSTGYFGGKTVGEISAQYETLVTPAGYAFSIWGLIYLFLIAFVVYQWYQWMRNKRDQDLKQTGIWFLLSNIFNASWIYFWLHGFIGVSMLILLLLLGTLIVLTIRLKLEIWDAPVRTIVFVWWPICIYLGWIIAASVANIAVYLKSLEFNLFDISESTWAMTLLITAGVIYIFLILTRNLREAAGIGIWAFIAIAVKQWEANWSIVVTSLVLSAVLFLLIIYQGYKNRDTALHKKFIRGEV